MDFRSHCPVNYALEHFGDKWSLLIIRDLMFKGKRHYNEFLEGGEKVSTSVLRDKLRLLEEGGIIRKGPDVVKKSRIRYSLTQKGIDMLPLMVDLIAWSGNHDSQTAAEEKFLKDAATDREELIRSLREQLNQHHLGSQA